MQYGYLLLVMSLGCSSSAFAESANIDAGMDMSVLGLLLTGGIALLIGRKAKKFDP